MTSYDYLYKILLIGDSGVGKSAIILRFGEDNFIEKTIPTIGVDFCVRTLVVNDKIIKLQLWDTAGQERFKTITQSYYRGAFGVIIAYDVTNEESFNNVPKWIGDCLKKCNSNVTIIIVATKCDVDKSLRKVSTLEGEKLASRFGYKFIETSSKKNVCIDDMFYKIIDEITHNYIKPKNTNDNIGLISGLKNKNKKKCC
jgi:small GTP-binding protein